MPSLADPATGIRPTDTTLHGVVVRGATDVAKLAAAWRALFLADTDARPYLHPAFNLRPMVLSRRHEVPLCLTIETESRQLVGLLPLVIATRRNGPLRRKVLLPMAVARSPSFGCLAAPGYSDIVAERLAEMLAVLTAELDEIDLRFFRPNARLGPAIIKQGCLQWEMNPEPAVGSQFDGVLAWQELVGGHARRNIGRRRRNLEEAHPDLRIDAVEPGPDFGTWAKRFQALYSERNRTRGWTDGYGLGREAPDYPAVLEAMVRDGAASLYAIRFGDTLVAAEILGHVGEFTHSLATVYDPEWSSAGPGVMLHSVVLQEMIARGFRTFNFGLRPDAYKMQWANWTEPTLRIFWERHSLAVRLVDRLGALRDRLRDAQPTARNPAEE
ncbi:MAG TPA: GNAT family N-acetyltransferase [Gemmatimonadales bacterium]|jgi:CelD/BcsL family acetyltransferase involved in cellulose biosynthesis